jgi:hypothetical protein
MIKDVTFEHTQYQDAPVRFEAGTGSIADAVGLGATIDYLNRIGIDPIAQYEHEFLNYATRLLKEIPGLRLIGTAPDKAGVISFILKGHKTEDIGAALNREGIAVRSGPPLRPADSPLLWCREHGSGIAGVVQHLRRRPQPCYGAQAARLTLGQQGRRNERLPCPWNRKLLQTGPRDFHFFLQ